MMRHRSSFRAIRSTLLLLGAAAASFAACTLPTGGTGETPGGTTSSTGTAGGGTGGDIGGGGFGGGTGTTTTGTGGAGGTGVGGAGGAGGGTGGGSTSECGDAWAYRHAQADAAQPSGLAMDADGNVILATGFTGNPDASLGMLDFDGGTSVLIVKRDPQGALLWAKGFDATNGFDAAEAVVVSKDTGIIYVTGQVSAGTQFGGNPPQGINGPAMFIAAFQPDGSHEWDYQLPNSHGHAIAVGANSVVMAGHSTAAIDYPTQSGTQNVDYGGGAADAFVVRVTANNIWAQSFGDDKAQRAFGVAIQSGGEVIVAGEFESTIDFGNGNSETSVNALDGFIGKVNGGNGTGIGSMAIHGSSTQSVRAVAVDANNNVVFAATVREEIVVANDNDSITLPGGANEDILIGKLGPGLEVAASDDDRWLRRFEANNDQRATAVHIDKDGNIYLAGSLKGTIDFGDGVTLSVPTDKFSAFVAAFDGTGKALFARPASVAGKDVHATGIAADACHNILFSGTYDGALTIDPTMLPDVSGGHDSFLARILPAPAIP